MKKRVERGVARTMAAIVLVLACADTAHAQAAAGGWTDWGGGYLRGPDSASVTVATSGAGPAKPAALAVPPTPTKAVPMTDWGGGYLRGPDSASTTVATSGAGTPKPAP